MLPPPDEVTPFEDGALYDLILGSIDYGFDYYVNLVKAAEGPVLDVACGTGRILIPALQAGVDIEGVDLFQGMLTQLVKKTTALGLKPVLHHADMRSFRLDRRFALIVIPFNAIIHSLNTSEQLATLESCRKHLLPGGSLVFDTFFPGRGIIAAPDRTRVLEMETTHPETGQVIRMYDTRTFNLVEQWQHSETDIEFIDADGTIAVTHQSKFSTRWIYKSEMELLLRVAGYDRWKISGDYDGRPLVNETDMMLVQAWSGSVRIE